ncbi:MAG: AGE family epimerase/isomerase [Beijerinckiaceae bacterium]|nr:AGE family epimerase/isomerase [Beijerinckiaceae bacterium]
MRDALPFWADIGFDQRTSSFHERLDFSGVPIGDAPRRTMAQCRQIYVYAHAHELGWSDQGADRAMRAVHSLISRHWSPDGARGWVFSIRPDGKVHDPRRDTYAHAFVLLGLAWAYRIDPSQKLLDLADQTLAIIDTLLAAEDHGGFTDGVPRPDALRRQNPHMHLFEANLAWFEASGEARFLARAGEIFGLFTTRFFDPERGALLEYFDDRWRPAAGQAGTICEPGHHFEWVWLLLKFSRLSGRSVSRYTGALFDHAEAFGRGENGLLYDEVCTSGTLIKGSQRCWPHTEAVKAIAALHEAGVVSPRSNHREHAAAYLDCLMDHYLGRPFAGGWIDHYNADGTPKVDFVPSSTLYHAFLAIAEADRVFSALPA